MKRDKFDDLRHFHPIVMAYVTANYPPGTQVEAKLMRDKSARIWIDGVRHTIEDGRVVLFIEGQS